MKTRLDGYTFAALVSVCFALAGWSMAWSADPFYTPVKGWGQWIDPDDDCNLSFDDHRLVITIPDSPHGLDADRSQMNSPRVMRIVSGDFAINVTIDGGFWKPNLDAPSAREYVSGGLLLMLDEKNYVRLERATFTNNGKVNHYLNFERREAARVTRLGAFTDRPIDPDERLELRLEVVGPLVRGLVRAVDQPWHEMGTTRYANRDTLMVGIAACNNRERPLEVSYSELQVESNPKAAIADTSSKLDLDPARAGQLALDAESRAQLAKIAELQKRSADVATMDDNAREALISDGEKLIGELPKSIVHQAGPSIAMGLPGSFEGAGLNDWAGKAYERLIAKLESLEDERMTSMIKRVRQNQERLAMIGKPMPLEGEILGGEKLDWTKYEGKVVLVDFWASWCGPCIAEIPNVLDAYKKHHENGFEVLGICLDSDRAKAEALIESKEIPWPSLYEEGAGGKHPMAARYQISAIPTAVLLDREGNIVTWNARGKRLGNLLDELMSKSQPDSADEPDDK